MASHDRNTILIVDDMVINRIFLRNILKEDYDLLEAGNGEQAIQLLQRHHETIVAVLLDIMMPVKDGFETLSEMGMMGYLDEFPVIVITSDSDSKNEAKILELGASDMIHKPYDPVVVKRRISNLVGLFTGRRQIESRADDLERVISASNTGVISMLATVTEFRSFESGQHTLRIKSFTQILLKAVQQRFPEFGIRQRDIDLIGNTSILHDVGKVMIPDCVLNKPGRLTDDEFELMKSHTTAGSEILNKMRGMVDHEFMEYAYNICRYHHERWDGNGYPEGLQKNNIPLCAQVVGLSDVYDALTTPRVYKKAFSHEKAVSMILNGECGAFNPQILECFQLVLDEFRNCARDYADASQKLNTDDIGILPDSASATLLDHAEKITNAKYNALRLLVNGVVVEIDMNSGDYNMVYNSTGKMSQFNSVHNLNSMVTDFLNNYVHPQDKLIAMQQFLDLQSRFFEEGIRKKVVKYRLRTDEYTDYFWVSASNVRIQTGRPSDKMALCVWNKIDYTEQASTQSVPVCFEPDPFWNRLPCNLVCCRQDRWMSVEYGIENLSRLTGYSKNELADRFQNHFSDLIYPLDQESVSDFLWKIREKTTIGDLEYRIVKKDGSIVWILDKIGSRCRSNGEEYIYHIMIDYTKTRKSLNDIQLKLDRQQLLLNNASEIFFEWDLDTDYAFFTENFKDTFGYSLENEKFSQYFKPDFEHVFHDDAERIHALFSKVKDGKSFAEEDIRLLKFDGSYIWCRIRAVGQQWENGKTVSILGSITNIDEDKLALQNLKFQTERDSLTGLLNRAASTAQFKRYLANAEEGQNAALLILDIDNFKRVNDTFGHLAGDSVLISCGEAIRRQFRKKDIVARIGGDEYMICLLDVPDEKRAADCCQKIVDRFMADVSVLVPDCDISCSVGAAMYPENGMMFDELFSRADSALLFSKEHGKNQYAFYGDIQEEHVAYRSNRTEIESNESPNLSNQGLVEYALHHLYRSWNYRETIDEILEMVGTQTHSSRVFVYQKRAGMPVLENTFEWCNQGVRSVQSDCQEVDYYSVKAAWESRNQKSYVLYCRDTHLLPDSIRSITDQNHTKCFVLCPIMRNNKVCGFVGMSDCAVKRLWTTEQISTLESFAEVLSLFLLKDSAEFEGFGRNIESWHCS